MMSIPTKCHCGTSIPDKCKNILFSDHAICVFIQIYIDLTTYLPTYLVSVSFFCTNYATGTPISWKFKNKRNTWFILLLVCLYSLSVISGCWVIFWFFDVSTLWEKCSYRETSKNCSKSPRPTQKSHSMNKAHKEQDKSSISFIFKFPTDWGACD